MWLFTVIRLPFQSCNLLSLPRTRVKKFTPPLKSTGNEAKPDVTETFTIPLSDAKFNGSNNNEVKPELVAHQTFMKENIPPNPKESNRANSAGCLNISETKTQSRSRSCDETLKHYNGQTNLLDCKPLRKRSNASDDDVFDNEAAASGSIDQPRGKKIPATSKSSLGLPPALPRRYRRQPTIENSVCFQEVSECIFHLDCVHAMPAHFENDEKFDG